MKTSYAQTRFMEKGDNSFKILFDSIRCGDESRKGESQEDFELSYKSSFVHNVFSTTLMLLLIFLFLEN